jgi:hypothetical protein
MQVYFTSPLLTNIMLTISALCCGRPGMMLEARIVLVAFNTISSLGSL